MSKKKKYKDIYFSYIILYYYINKYVNKHHIKLARSRFITLPIRYVTFLYEHGKITHNDMNNYLTL